MAYLNVIVAGRVHAIIKAVVDAVPHSQQVRAGNVNYRIIKWDLVA